MSYQNRRPPENINASKEPWVRDFILLVLGFVLVSLLLLWMLLRWVTWAAAWIPIGWEVSLADRVVELPVVDERQNYIRELAEGLAQAGAFDERIPIRVHLDASSEMNAFATLGGNLFILRGLVDLLETEQGLAFVVAHELAHLHYRHPIKAVTQQLSFAAFVGLVFGRSDLTQWVGTGGQLLNLDYSREYEREADAWALQAVYHYYGHTEGADEFFQQVVQNHQRRVPAWLSTHPDTRERLQALQQQAQQAGWRQQGKLIPLSGVEALQ